MSDTSTASNPLPPVIINPPGGKGKDFDVQILNLHQGSIASITASCTTIPTGPGNTSSVALFIDGTLVSTGGGSIANCNTSVELTQPGQHTVVAICGNRWANASTCTIDIRPQPPVNVGGRAP